MIRRGRDGQRGQSMVEFAFIVPLFLLFLLGLLELGFAFDHLMTLDYATREGARTGAALADGSNLSNCNDVDKYVVSAVERVLASTGSPIKDNLARVTSIRIYKADNTGQPSGTLVNTWVPGNGPTVDGRPLDFIQQASGWSSCTRSNATSNPDSLAVAVTYNYHAITPLAAVLDFFGGGGWTILPMSDKTVMALNPTD